MDSLRFLWDLWVPGATGPGGVGGGIPQGMKSAGAGARCGAQDGAGLQELQGLNPTGKLGGSKIRWARAEVAAQVPCSAELRL